MRRSLIFFLGCVLSITTSVEGKSMDVSPKGFLWVNNAMKDNGIVPVGVKSPSIQSQFIASDSLKATATAKDTVHHKKHRLIAALLSFPIIGIFGLHRIYLGTSPQVPFVYIVTAGGGFGVLPFIDFVMILLSKNKDFHATYTGNHHLFMWQKAHK
jgi:TM2 domain-containing membrane protein YozV